MKAAVVFSCALSACAGRLPPGAEPMKGPIAESPVEAQKKYDEAMQHYDYAAALKAANDWLALAPKDAEAAVAVAEAATSIADMTENDDTANAYIDRATEALAPFVDAKVTTPPEQVAAVQYTAAEALGIRARERGTGALLLVHSIYKHAKAAEAANANFNDGAPRRLLGLLMVKAPGWPEGPGDAEAGTKMLEAVVHDFPRAAENYVLLADAYLDQSRVNDAGAVLALAKPLLTANPRTQKLYNTVAERLRTNRGVKAYKG